MRHRRPPARSLGTAVLAAVAALVAVLAAVVVSVLLTDGRGASGGAQGAVALEITAADTDGDGIPDGSPLDTGTSVGTEAPPSGDPVARGAPEEPVAARPAPSAPAPPTADGPVPDGAATPIDAARGFVAALAHGDTEAAYRLMHPRYRAAFGTYAGFAERAPTARFAPFGVLGSAHYQSTTFEERVDDEPVAVVSTHGLVSRDGTERAETLAVVARRGAEGWLVEVAGEGGSAFRRPEAPGERVAASDPILVWSPAGEIAQEITDVVAVLDGEPATTTVTPLADPADTVEIRIGEHAPDARQVLVGVLRSDGSVDTVATFLGS
ncbi:MAG: hypothetical protein AB7G09_00470 [Pseudonocardia sp.]